MRITNKSVYTRYLGHLENIQNNKLREETRLTTGKQITGIEEQPERLSEIKILQSKISKNNGFLDIIEQTLSEMRVAMESMEYMSATVKQIRQTAIDATQPGSSSSLSTYANQIKSMLQDLVGQANADFNGRTLYSGTATNPGSLVVDPLDAPYSSTELPFELIEVPPTTANPSGLKVIFKGNNNDRIVNKDSATTEVTNVKSQDLFGSNMELFNDIINIYNTVRYNADGTLRSDTDEMTSTDRNTIDSLQKTLLDHDQKMTNTIALFGSRYNRVDSMFQQLTNENIRMSEIKSLKADADIARTTIALKMEETSLLYSLQVGARIMQNSLFDFLR
ncbi:MAG: hypothetical protein KIT33_12515 [Candidatus Kapabacteria bacterium]|nr:hypothetical protein [Ignavibacteriota bacterium]MCW5885784.1 hypothetical protein [Candidatus Kapabacteria bacterium]